MLKNEPAESILIEIGRRLTKKSYFGEYKNRPVEFVREVLKAEPDENQRPVLEALVDHNKVAWRSGHGIGKTADMSFAAIWFLFTRENSKVITTASVWRQVSKMLWSEIAKWVRRARSRLAERVSFELLKTNLIMAPDWFATGEASDEPDKIEGFHAEKILYIVDEAKAVPRATFEAIEGALTTKDAKELVASTPPLSKSGYFYDICSRKISGYKLFHTSCLDSKRVSKAWIKDKKEQWGENNPVYQARVLGEFPETSEDTLIPLNLIEAAIDRVIENYNPSPRELGIDVARFGSDKTVFIERNGSKVVSILKTDKEDTMRTSGRANRIIKDRDIEKAKVDSIGVGAGVCDKLREDFGDKIVDVNVGSKSSEPEKYLNLRAEIFDGLRQRFVDKDMSIPDDEELIGEISDIKYKYNSRGQMQIESKEEMKKRRGHSPDSADGLSLAFYKGEEPFEILIGRA